jgi:predicted nucleotidyltransferase
MKINIPDNLPTQQLKAFTEIAKKLFENPEIDTLFLSGSFYHGNHSSNSDLDFLAITKSDVDYFQRIQDVSNGVFYELFVYSEKQLKRSFELMDYQDMHMVGYGFPVFSKSYNFENIRKLAKDLFEKGPKKIHDKELEYEKYLLWDKYTDILDILEKDSGLASSLMHLLLWDSLKLLYIKKCVWFPKKKRLFESLIHVDNEIHSLTGEFLNPVSGNNKRFKILSTMIEKIIYPRKLSEPFVWQGEKKKL